MLTLNILGGPKRREALCPTCVYSVMQKGFKGEELTCCSLGGGMREMKFPVGECNGYIDRRIIRPEREVGFVRASERKQAKITVIKIA